MSNTYGFFQPSDAGADFNVMRFILRMVLTRVRTCAIVQVKAVTPPAGGKPGLVDAVPMVSMLDGNGQAMPHGKVANLFYFRLQAGANAIEADPAAGDIGFAVICVRDSSVVKATGKPGAPGSARMHDLADGIYCGGLAGLNPTPTQGVSFTANGLTVFDKNGHSIAFGPSGIVITGAVTFANDITVDGAATVDGVLAAGGDFQLAGNLTGASGGVFAGDLKTSGAVVAGQGTGDQVGLQTHKHTTVTNTGTPTAPIAGT